jgi:phage gp16-like protein
MTNAEPGASTAKNSTAKKSAGKAIAAIQACRRQVAGLADDDTWRAFLDRVVGKMSLRAMSGAELGRVLDALHAAGAPRPQGKAAGGRSRYRGTPQLGKLRALWLELAGVGAVRDRSDAALSAYIKKMTGQDMGQLAADDAGRAIEGLKAWLRRAKAAGAAAADAGAGAGAGASP